MVGTQSRGEGIPMSTRWTWNPLTLGLSIIAVGGCSRADQSAIPSRIDSGPTPAGSSSMVESIPIPPEAAADPVYDLSADIAERTRFVRERFGNPTRVKIEGEAFVVADPDHGAMFDPGVSLMDRAIHALLMPGHFQSTPDRAVTVLLFSSHASFVAFSKERYGLDPKGLYGYYRRSKREILVDGTSGLPTLTHEIVHPFMQHEAGRLPAWIDEGVASLFEYPSFSPDDGSMHGLTNWRLGDLRTALASPDIAPTMRLDALFGMSDREFLGEGDPVAERRNYALARFVCQYLDSMKPGKLWTFLASWREAFEDDPTGGATFTRVVGVSPAQANGPFLRWVALLKQGSTGAPASLQ